METKLTNKEVENSRRAKNGSREIITLTVFAVFFVIALGLLFLSQA